MNKLWTSALVAVVLVLLFWQGSTLAADGKALARVVVLPDYLEQQSTDGAQSEELSVHFRRVITAVLKQLVKHEFKVIDPFSANSVLVEPQAESVAKRYGADIAIIVQLDVTAGRMADGLCTANVQVQTEGYDGPARNVEWDIEKRIRQAGRDCGSAIQRAEEQAGYVLGLRLVGRLEKRWTGTAE